MHQKQPLMSVIERANALRNGATVTGVESHQIGDNEKIVFWALSSGETLVLTKNRQGFTGVLKRRRPLRYLREEYRRIDS